MKDKLIPVSASPSDLLLEGVQTSEEYEDERAAERAPTLSGVRKGLSPAFGRPDRRRAQLVARLKRRRKYADPVKGGTGRNKKKNTRGHFK